ncbi:Domain of unknown function (DUF1978) [Chlamydia serpentis]|uniref:DUF1978 domain-containing protein n=1 Tax=Chlamydia serpentis TaxID=1967782 RepID=A0A2R8FCL9_9CHLA|nr:DUF1978 domain-containing protein [Chlamydia serpentis]SPN74159.1 Domain of unknown function (DUF1978) [Chlamydia serpentis]
MISALAVSNQLLSPETTQQESPRLSIIKSRVFEITLLILGIIFLICGVILFTISIPGFSSVLSLGIGVFTSVLGVLVFSLGILLLIINQGPLKEVSKQDSPPSSIEMSDPKKPLNVGIRELNQAVAYLEKSRNWTDQNQDLVEKTEKQLKSLDFNLKNIFLEISDIRFFLEQKEYYFMEAQNYLESSANEMILNLKLLSNTIVNAAIDESKIRQALKNAETLTFNFIDACAAFKKVQANFEESSFILTKHMFEKSLSSLEQLVFKNIVRSHKQVLFLNTYPTERPLQKDHLLDQFKQNIFCLKEDGTIDLSDAIHWALPARNSRKNIEKIQGHKLWSDTHLYQMKLLKYLSLKSIYNNQPTEKNHKQLCKAKKNFDSQCDKLQALEYNRVEAQLKELKDLYPNVEVPINPSSITKEFPNVKPSLQQRLNKIQEEANLCKKQQAKYFKELEEKRSSHTDKSTAKKKNKCQKSLEKLQLSSSTVEQYCADLKASLKNINLVLDEKTTNTEILYIEKRLKALEEELKDIPNKIGYIEKLLSHREAMLFTTNEHLSNAQLQRNTYSTSEITSASDTLLKQLQDFDIKIQNISSQYEKEKELLFEKKNIFKQSVNTFEATSLNFIKEELLQNMSELQFMARSSASLRNAIIPSLKIYISYFEREYNNLSKKILQTVTKYKTAQHKLISDRTDSKSSSPQRVTLKEKDINKRQRKEDLLVSQKLQILEERIRNLKPL